MHTQEHPLTRKEDGDRREGRDEAQREVHDEAAAVSHAGRSRLAREQRVCRERRRGATAGKQGGVEEWRTGKSEERLERQTGEAA